MSLFDQMVSRYSIVTENDRRNVICEVMQEITLAGLYRGGFFDKAAFYGGTCLRIFHSLNRFSEDMDFSLLSQDETFELEAYFPSVINEFKAMGRDVIITRKDKQVSGNIESAFLKNDTSTYDVAFQTQKELKIKIEVDIHPPLSFSTENKLLMLPYSFMTRCFTLPDLFAGKMHAFIFRNWKSRVKGRDWYDFEWYVRNNIPFGFDHFCARAKQISGLNMDKKTFYTLLKDRISSTDISLVKQDVRPFVRNPEELDIWSNDYFMQLVERIHFQ